jgi:hypothetical protein
MSKLRTHYDNLKVARDAPSSVIRAAYKTLTQQYHPDKNPGDSRAARVMQLINASYEVLSNPERRKQHDEWIREQEAEAVTGSPSHSPTAEGPQQAAPRSNGQGVRVPLAGSCCWGDLSGSAMLAMCQLMGAKAEFQSFAPLTTKTWQTGWLAAAVAFLAYVVYDSLGYRWDRDAVGFFQFATPVAGAVALYCAFYLWRWHHSHLRPALILTPLFLIATNYRRVRFWPLSDVNVVRVTHHHYNGSYTHTSAVMQLDGQWRTFKILTKPQFEEFSAAFSRFGGALNKAAHSGDQRYVERFDIFADSKRSSPPRVSFAFLGPVGVSVLGGLLAFGLFVGLAGPNETRLFYQASPYTPIPPAATAPRYSAPASAPSEPRKDHIEALLGRATPSRASYVSGQPRLNTNGLSTVTVDNGRNDADVLVKLVSLDRTPAFPVRVFYIPALSEFTVEEVAPGRYDVRYLERWSGSMARSDPFELEQRPRADGIEYSQLTLTLYKVQNGNMQTHKINESEF